MYGLLIKLVAQLSAFGVKSGGLINGSLTKSRLDHQHRLVPV